MPDCIIDKLQRISEDEINFKIECFYDAGFTVSLGDDMNGYVWSDTFTTLEGGIRELIINIKRFCKKCY